MADRPRHTEACPEWAGDIAAWAVAQGSPAREAALVEHLEGCAACRAEAEGLLAIAAVVLAADPDVAVDQALDPEVVEADVGERSSSRYPEPPADLGERIGRRIRRERRRQLVRRSLVVAVGAAAAAAVLVFALAMRAGDGGVGPVNGDHFAFAVVPPGATAGAVVGHDDGQGSVVQLIATGLDPTTTYALWLTPPGGTYEDRVPAGTFRPGRDGTVNVRLHCSLSAGRVGRVWATTDRTVVLDTA